MKDPPLEISEGVQQSLHLDFGVLVSKTVKKYISVVFSTASTTLSKTKTKNKQNKKTNTACKGEKYEILNKYIYIKIIKNYEENKQGIVSTEQISVSSKVIYLCILRAWYSAVH